LRKRKITEGGKIQHNRTMRTKKEKKTEDGKKEGMKIKIKGFCYTTFSARN